ncbi:DUF490 domain-containing protein [Erythrobacter litoralis]|uniref:translocation/assembly module TamB domain-containing protein n=1 Tax=Erythrobacter litoralis TaxID=39960 RepID=UPI002434D94A|nr:translocation/assembly module TamB domain-containing protein [Erythrobacter litoralis]MDG6077664.1 DUF490 domain-containing protein [Erythrobacter litoralis]
MEGADLPAQNDTPRREWGKRVVKWAWGLVAAAVLLAIGAVALLNTPLGERFLANLITERTFPNGLNVRIGRIDGNIYGEAVLHDVVLSDPQGPFATVPRIEIDWHPRGWLSNRLDIDKLALRRATLARLPKFLASEEDNPILPGFDISVDRLEVENLMLAPGIAGDVAQRVDLLANVQIDDRRLLLDGRAIVGEEDRLAIMLDAAPDRDRFALSLDLAAARQGPLTRLAGLENPYTARVRGSGSWREWNGVLVARSEGQRVAALQLSNRAGRFGALGRVDLSDFLTGLAARALGEDVALDANVRIDDRTFDGSIVLGGSGIFATGEGLIDLAENQFGDFRVSGRVRNPALLSEGLRLADTRFEAVLDGAFADLTLRHDLRVGELRTGTFRFTGLRQRGTARRGGAQWIIPLDLGVQRVTSGNAWVDPRLVNGRGRGNLVLSGSRLTGDNLALAFRDLGANLSLRADLGAGTYRVAGPVRARGLQFDNIGVANGTARIDLFLGRAGAWRIGADLNGRIARVTNSTLAALAGPSIAVGGSLATGASRPIEFGNVRVTAAKLAMTLDGTVRDGRTVLAGRGRQSQYGPFTVEAGIDDNGPTAAFVFAEPASGLSDVRLSLAPSQDGFAIDASGSSVLGPFDGAFGLTSRAGGPTLIDIERLRVSDTEVDGLVSLVDGGIRGTLSLTGGGLDGTIGLAPRGGGQGLVLDLTARNARFEGTGGLAIAQGEVDARGVIAAGRTTFSGTANARGLSYGSLFIGRLAARGEVTNGTGQVDANISGSRGSRFALNLNAQFRPDRIGVAARGSFAGRRIAMPRRAILQRVGDDGWRLQPTQIMYGEGGALLTGTTSNGQTRAQVKLASLPLSLSDALVSDLGLGGTISGVIDYADTATTLPTADLRVKVDDLTRSGLILTSRPVDLSLVARLEPTRLEARAVLNNADIRRGRIQAIITGLPPTGDLTQRLRQGRLAAQLRYQGAAESLWRLAAVDAIDITGPIAIAANASGTLANPAVRGSLSSDDLRVRSTLSGTDLRNVGARGRFAGSRLRLERFQGETSGGGRVTGSGIVDLAGLGERVERRFTEIRGPTLDLKASATNARLVNANGLSATVTGPLRIVSNGLGGTIAGRVRVNRASWTLGTAADDLRLPQIATREINLPPDRAPGTATSRPWRYLIDARANNRIEVDGLGLDSEWGANVVLRGTTAEPRIGGTAQLVQGEYTFAGTQFDLVRGEIAFDETAAIDPRLDIRAETDRQGLTVVATVTGTSAEPEIVFSSEPVLPEEEILARLLFGGSITSLSATDALQLGTALASLRGGAGLDPINQLRDAIGLDRLRIVAADPVLDRGTSVALGKNIGRRIYVELITDGRGYSATEVEFRVTRWLSLLASVSTVGRESAVAEISRDY